MNVGRSCNRERWMEWEEMGWGKEQIVSGKEQVRVQWYPPNSDLLGSELPSWINEDVLVKICVDPRQLWGRMQEELYIQDFPVWSSNSCTGTPVLQSGAQFRIELPEPFLSWCPSSITPSWGICTLAPHCLDSDDLSSCGEVWSNNWRFY